MLKSFLFYVIIAALLHGGHFVLLDLYPNKFEVNNLILTQSFLFLVFIFSDVLIFFIARQFKIFIGQVFLLTTTFKIIGTGTYLLILKGVFKLQLSKYFILVFMLSYFVYLTIEVYLFIKKLAKEKSNF